MRTVLCALAIASGVSIAHAQDVDANYPDRKAYIINSCPHVELSAFSYQNRYADRGNRFETKMNWTNIAKQPLVAFEIVILKYDAFNRRLIGERWTVTGTNSANWSPLGPGASSGDGTIGFRDEEVFTAIAYVRAARLADGTTWEVNLAQLTTELKKVAPGFKEFGKLEPDPKAKPDQ